MITVWCRDRRRKWITRSSSFRFG